MNKLLTIAMALAVIAASAMPLSPKSDPVLVTINGEPTTLSEFMYYYNKNCSADGITLSPEEYLELYINFRLKVTEAQQESRDTLKTFLDDYDHFKKESLAPYLLDSALLNEMVAEAYSHLWEDIDISHIMVGTSDADHDSLAKILSDLRTGKCDFDSIAYEISVDPSAKVNRGHIGWISAGRYPYPFENVAYETPVGTYSEPFSSGFGYHVLKVHDRRPTKGEVHVRHILRSARPNHFQEVSVARRSIDSIYNLLGKGADFGVLAGKYSDDKASAVRGGDLGWFSAGVMVTPFDSIAFAMKDLEVSEPFASPYGYHIIKKLGHRSPLPLDSLRGAIEKRFYSDGRIALIRQAKIKSLKDKYDMASATDSAVVERFFSEIVASDPNLSQILKEYRDGTLLFDISAEQIWNKASADTAGLESFFASHRSDYRWDKPHYKALLIYTTSEEDKEVADSVLNNATQDMADDEIALNLRTALSNRVRIERVIAGQGENEWADYFAFEGKRPGLSSRWTSVRPFRDKHLYEPESFYDVKGKVIADRQDELERIWLENLRKKYPVKVNRKVLKQITDLYKKK